MAARCQPVTRSAPPGDWASTRDNVTGLTWEIKVDDAPQMHHASHTYTGYDLLTPDGPGATGSTTSCNPTLGANNCNTANYVAAVNAAQLCGFTDGRMPTVKDGDMVAVLAVRHQKEVGGS